jgi:hypothetical protein
MVFAWQIDRFQASRCDVAWDALKGTHLANGTVRCSIFLMCRTKKRREPHMRLPDRPSLWHINYDSRYGKMKGGGHKPFSI